MLNVIPGDQIDAIKSLTFLIKTCKNIRKKVTSKKVTIELKDVGIDLKEYGEFIAILSKRINIA